MSWSRCDISLLPSLIILIDLVQTLIPIIVTMYEITSALVTIGYMEHLFHVHCTIFVVSRAY